MNFKIILEKDEDGYFVATCPALSGCISQGATEQEALKNIKEAITLHLTCLSEDGLPFVKRHQAKEVLLNVGL
jgi:predicted RNase H-like HicB family nuclease